MKTLWSALLTAALLATAAPAADAAASAYARYTAPLPLAHFQKVQKGWTLTRAEATLGVRFKYVGLGKNGSRIYRHWTSAARTPYAELWATKAGVIVGTTQVGMR